MFLVASLSILSAEPAGPTTHERQERIMNATLIVISFASDIIAMAAGAATLIDTVLRYWGKHRKNG